MEIAIKTSKELGILDLVRAQASNFSPSSFKKKKICVF